MSDIFKTKWFRQQKQKSVRRFALNISIFSTRTANKVHPRTGHKGPEGEYRHRSTFSLTSALDEGRWLKPRHGSFGLYRGSFLGVKRPGRKAGHSRLSSAEVNNEWSYTFTPLVFLHGVGTDYFTFV
jgi:hypothetical protein